MRQIGKSGAYLRPISGAHVTTRIIFTKVAPIKNQANL